MRASWGFSIGKKARATVSSTVSTPFGVRIPNEQVPALREQAKRYGLTPSKAIAATSATALDPVSIPRTVIGRTMFAATTVAP